MVAQSGAKQPLVCENLKPLGHARRKFPPTLNLTKLIFAGGAAQQRLRQNVRGGNGILDREIDSDPSHRRHRVSAVPDAQ